MATDRLSDDPSYPGGSEDYARLHVLRPDAESINRSFEDTLSFNRASGRGWRRQMVDILGWASWSTPSPLPGAGPGSR